MKNKIVIAVASIPAAFFLEHFLAAGLGPRVPTPPLTLLVAALWLPVLPLFPRLFLAGVAGFITDTVGGAQFGVFLLVFLGAALTAELFRSLISVKEWSVGHINVSSVLAVSALLLSPLAETVVIYIRAVSP